MESNHEKIVDFTFCRFCEHRKKMDYETPCDECLDNPVNTDSRRPLYFKSNGLLERIQKHKEKVKEIESKLDE